MNQILLFESLAVDSSIIWLQLGSSNDTRIFIWQDISLTTVHTNGMNVCIYMSNNVDIVIGYRSTNRGSSSGWLDTAGNAEMSYRGFTFSLLC